MEKFFLDSSFFNKKNTSKILTLFLISSIFIFSLSVSSTAEISRQNNDASFWNNFYVFKGTSAPYAANGPGCISGPTYSFDLMPGENCPNDDPAYDIGAVWVDLNTDYIAWMIYAPDLTSTGWCGGSNNNPNDGPAVAIEFDSDDNSSTGCGMAQPCYVGAEYQIWLYADNSSEVKQYNGNLPECDSDLAIEDQECFESLSGKVYNITFNVTCSTPSVLKLAINRSAISNLIGMNFMANSFKVPNPPSDTLGGEGMDKIMKMGEDDFMFMDEHPCFEYDGTTEEDCITDSQDLSGIEAGDCKWDSFEELCDPDMSAMGCSEFCGACDTAVACETGNKGKCRIVQAPPTEFLPPEANTFDDGGITSMCVEDFDSVKVSSGGDCDDDCKYCYSEKMCNNSNYPNPMGSGPGCQWVTDPFFDQSWCDLATFNTADMDCKETNPDRCFTQQTCEDVLLNWSEEFQLCYDHDDDGTVDTEYICFDGEDNDADNKIDCADPDCQKNPFCGGDIDVLTGGFGTLDPMQAMMKDMFSGMDPSPPVEVAMDVYPEFGQTPYSGDPLDLYDIISFDVKDMGKALGFGIHVEELAANSILCDGNIPSKFYYFVDKDANLSTGCNITLNNVNYTGFDYKYEYQIRVNSSGDGPLEIRRGYRCINSSTNKFGLYPAKLTGAPKMGFLGDEKLSCSEGVAVVAVEKKDIGNPKGNIRFMAATSDNITNSSNANDTILGSGNGGIYYTPGAVDFTPKDCFSNPSACGTAFSIVGGGKYMPFEDCFLGSGDEDLDGLSNCADPDCQMAPWCEGQYDLSSDKTAPTMYGNKVEAFKDFVFMHWTTNEPTNSTITFHNKCTNKTPYVTFYDLGNPDFSFDDFRPWHDIDISNGDEDIDGNTITFESGQNYKYKIKICDKAGNCGTSACLNFTTESSDKTIQYKFDFVPPRNPLVNQTKMKIWNGTDYVNITPGASNTQTNYLKNAKLKFDNPEANWEIEFEGIDLAKALNFNLSTAFNATNSSGDMFVGIANKKWTEMAQSLGVDSVLLKIPGTGNTLRKCEEDNLSNCNDVTSQATINETGDGYTKWKIPTSLGFSVYGTTQSGVTLSSGKSTYKAFPHVIVYYNITNANTTLMYKDYDLIINNSGMTGVSYNISFYNYSTGGGWQTAYGTSSDETSVNISGYNFTSTPSTSTYFLKINISMTDAHGGNWSINVSLYNGTGQVLSLLDHAIVDAVNLTTDDNTQSSTSTPSFDFTLFAGVENQSCELIINNTGYSINSSVPNATSTTLTANTTLIDGPKTWRIDCTTAAGDTGSSETRLLSVAEKPQVALNSPVDGYNTSSTSPTFNYTPSDSVDLNFTCELIIDDLANRTGLYSINGTHNTTTAESAFNDGAHTWSVNCTDAAGNEGNISSRAINIDTNEPSSYNLTLSSTTPMSNETIDLSVAWNDTVTGTKEVWLYMNSSGTYTVVNSTTTVTDHVNMTLSVAMTSGYIGKTLGVFMRGFDYLNQSSNTTTQTFLVYNSNGPTITVVTPSNFSNKSTVTPTLNFTASHAVDSSFSCSVSVNGVTNYTGTVTSGSYFANDSLTFNQGKHNWSVSCTDGNSKTSTTGNITFTVDSVAPTLSLTSPSNNTNVTLRQGIIVSFSDATTGVKTKTYTSSCGTSGTINSGTVFYPFNASGTTCSSKNATRTVRVNITDHVARSNVTTLSYGVDDVAPSVTAVSPNDGESLVNLIRFNWTSQDLFVKTSYIGYYLDNNPIVQLNFSATGLAATGAEFAANRTINLSAGNHSLIFSANDTVGNWGNSTEITFVVKERILLSDWITGLNKTLGTEISLPPIFRVKNSSGEYNEETGSQWSNNTYELILDVNSTGRPINVTLTDLDGSSANWEKINSTYIRTNNTGAYNGIMNNWTTTVHHMVYVNNSLEEFAQNSNAYYGTVIFPINTSGGVEFWWMEDETNLKSKTNISECGSVLSSPHVFTKTTTTPCFNFTSRGRTIVFVPHYSVVVASNDTRAPTITVNKPSTTQTVSGFIPNITVSSDAVRCGKYKLNITDITKTSATSNYSSSAGVLSGTACTWSEIRFKNGVYNITFNATDGSGNTNTTSKVFTMSDTTSPNSGDVTVSGTTTGATVTITNVNESVNATIIASNGTSFTTVTDTTFDTSHTLTISGMSTVTTATVRYFNLTLSDYNGNTITNVSVPFTQSATANTTTTTSSSSGGGGGAGGAVTSTNVLDSKSQMWSSIAEGTSIALAIDKKDIAVTELSVMNTKKELKDVELKVASLLENPMSAELKGKAYQYLQLTKRNVDDEDVTEIKIRFRVAKEWLSNNNYLKEDIILFRYKDGKWNELDTSYKQIIGSDFYYEAITPGFSFFVIGTKEASSEDSSSSEDTTDTNEDRTATETLSYEDSDNLDSDKSGEGVKTKWMWVIFIVIVIIGASAYFIVMREHSHNNMPTEKPKTQTKRKKT